mmetsp:Transcript_5362/g.13623  ORF Transcript_5362/g.13623 Transcript_5362/m.13623 type:complete len:243 (-) Transcript_5362:67-795(-)
MHHPLCVACHETLHKLIEEVLDVLLLQPAPNHLYSLRLHVDLHHLQKILDAAVVCELEDEVHLLKLLSIDHVVQLDDVLVLQLLQTVHLPLQVLLPIACLSEKAFADDLDSNALPEFRVPLLDPQALSHLPIRPFAEYVSEDEVADLLELLLLDVLVLLAARVHGCSTSSLEITLLSSACSTYLCSRSCGLSAPLHRAGSPPVSAPGAAHGTPRRAGPPRGNAPGPAFLGSALAMNPPKAQA